jgi:hypothetical protein
MLPEKHFKLMFQYCILLIQGNSGSRAVIYTENPIRCTALIPYKSPAAILLSFPNGMEYAVVLLESAGRVSVRKCKFAIGITKITRRGYIHKIR